MKIYVLYLYESHRYSENENFVFFLWMKARTYYTVWYSIIKTPEIFIFEKVFMI